MLILNQADVRRALPMAEAIAAMKRAFAALSAGRAIAPSRTHMNIEGRRGVSLIMPCYVSGDAGADEALAVKVVSLFEGNVARGLARIQAAVMAFDPTTGRPLAVLEGSELTAIRTAAATGAATDLLARADSATVALLGAGVQARKQLEAVCTVRRITAVKVFSPTRAKVQALIGELAGVGPIPRDVRPADSPRDALADADIVCCATTARQPVFGDGDLKPNAHVNAIGSYQPHVREVPAETVRRAVVVVDSRQAALEEAGDLIQPINAGVITADHVVAELGELVSGASPGRTSDDQLTLFKSVGVAVQDAFAASVALKNAEAQGLGQTVAW